MNILEGAVKITEFKSLIFYKSFETGLSAGDGHQAPDARGLSLTIFNGKEFSQTMEAQDRGFRGDPGSTGTSSQRAGVAV